ncbi:hypothetical protein Tco_0832095 [Tanacetum coccineum]
MARPLFNEIVTAVIDHDPFFRNNFDCSGKEGIFGLLKCTSANSALTDVEKLYLHHEEKPRFPGDVRKPLIVRMEVVGCSYDPETADDLSKGDILLSKMQESVRKNLLGRTDAFGVLKKNGQI